jgi:hypothetical protein
VCKNSASISERKITAALLGALKDTLTAPVVADAFVAAFERRVKGAKQAKPTDGVKQLHDAEARVANLTRAIARMPDSEALYAELTREESALKELHAQVDATPSANARLAPSRAAVRAGIGRLLDGLVAEAPDKARETLARVVTPLSLARSKAGTWTVTGGVRLPGLLANAGIGCLMS